MITNYIIHLLVLVAIYSILAVSLNLSLGYTGLLNLGHIALFGIGAYTSAILAKSGVPFVEAFIIAGLVASVFGFILIFATKKLKGDYLALTTLGFSFIIYSLMINWDSLTRGALGIAGIPKPSIIGIAIASTWSYLIFSAIIAIISITIMTLVVKSPFGRLMEATRDDELGLRALGKNTIKIKYKVMMISAFFAGIAGSLYAHYITFIDPSTFMIPEIIFVFTIVIVGGLASIRGSIIGAVIIVIVPELLRFLSFPGTVIGPLRMITYAVVLLAILMIKPRGIFGRVDLQ